MSLEHSIGTLFKTERTTSHPVGLRHSLESIGEDGRLYRRGLLCHSFVMAKDELSEPHFTLKELSNASGLTERAIRRYIQANIVARANGVTSNSWYGQDHLQTCVAVKRLSDRGLTLERIRVELAKQSGDTSGFGSWVINDISMRFIGIDKRVAIAIQEPRTLTAEQERLFVRRTRSLYREITGKGSGNQAPNEG